MRSHDQIIKAIFDAQSESGFWKVIPESHHYYPQYLHYVPNFKATLWTLIQLADLEHNPNDDRVQKPLAAIKKQFYDPEYGIYSLKEDHFPIPCLNGNMIYLDCYFNGEPSDKSMAALEFFYQNQRIDDGEYVVPKNEFCKNTSCYGKHTCYWGVEKLLKGISFIPKEKRTPQIKELLAKCIDFVLLHKVCYSSHKEGKIMIKKMDALTFPNMYKADFLEILWLLKREGVQSEQLKPALDLLKSKQQQAGHWNLERKMNNLTTSVGEVGKENRYVTKRAKEVLEYYG